MAAKQLAFVAAYFRNNLSAALEYRTSLISQVFGMFVNDILWVAFWALYFTKFPVLKGWTLEDVIVLWAVVTTAFGLAAGLMANSLRIPQLVVQGQLDYYLALPKNVLLHLLVSQMRLVNFGDLLFGPVLLLVMVDLTWTKLLVFLLSTLLAAMVLLGFFILTGSLTFFLGNSDALSGQLTNALLHFSTYPAVIFEQGVKFILFTLIPAAFVSTLPVELVREFSWGRFLQLLGGAALFLGLAVWLFHRGLRRYESGNLMVMRS
ncbi:MAG: ABC transporter permease [Bacillota bacterium]